MARKTMQALLRSSVKEAVSLGAEHRKIVESLGTRPEVAVRSDNKAQLKGSTSRSDLQVLPSDPTLKPHHQVRLEGQENCEPNFVKGRERPLTKNQQRVFDYLLRQGPHVTDKSIIAEATGLSPFTVKTILTRLTSLGMLERSRTGQGTRLFAKHPSSGSLRGPTLMSDTKVQQLSPTIKLDFHPSKINRKREILSISEERIILTWPNLAAAGLGSHQIEQIEEALVGLGKPADRIIQSLDHAEWELEHGKMLDKDGRIVTDPCSWVFRSLARTGYYRRPVGYVSAEEQAIRDAKIEIKALAQARQDVDTSAFEAWKGALSADDMREAMRGHPGGPKDAWLRRVWKERQTAGG